MDAKVTWKSWNDFRRNSRVGILRSDGNIVGKWRGKRRNTPDGDGAGRDGGCTAMDVVPSLQRSRQEVHDLEIRLHAERACEHPHVFTEITMEYVVTGHNVDPVAVARAIELSETKYCSVSAMLQKSAKVTTKYTVIEG